MCGRYAFALRPSEVRQQLESANMPSQEAPQDDEVRQSYNFAPGYHGLVYRADVPDSGASSRAQNRGLEEVGNAEPSAQDSSAKADSKISYKLQSMKWGLVPFWTKRNPEYSSMLKTINCRDDSLLENRGMWTSMKMKKRCIVVCQGFFEWLKRNDGKDRIPHFVKRKDGSLMCFAGLWDCVEYEGSDEKHYTYTVITTDSNKQLNFLHDRMPVILDNGSENIRTWLDPNRNTWTAELQSILQPYDKELDCYPVSKEVGKVGNNSPSFLIPIDSAKNKNNIANFFEKPKDVHVGPQNQDSEDLDSGPCADASGFKTEPDGSLKTPRRSTLSENNAPLPIPHGEDDPKSVKLSCSPSYKEDESRNGHQQDEQGVIGSKAGSHQAVASIGKRKRTTKSSSNNNKGSPSKSPKSHHSKNQKITSFFGK